MHDLKERRQHQEIIALSVEREGREWSKGIRSELFSALVAAETVQCLSLSRGSDIGKGNEPWGLWEAE